MSTKRSPFHLYVSLTYNQFITIENETSNAAQCEEVLHSNNITLQSESLPRKAVTLQSIESVRYEEQSIKSIPHEAVVSPSTKLSSAEHVTSPPALLLPIGPPSALSPVKHIASSLTLPASSPYQPVELLIGPSPLPKDTNTTPSQPIILGSVNSSPNMGFYNHGLDHSDPSTYPEIPPISPVHQTWSPSSSFIHKHPFSSPTTSPIVSGAAVPASCTNYVAEWEANRALENEIMKPDFLKR